MNLHDLIRKYADGGLIEATPEVGSMYAQQASQRPIEQYPTMRSEGPQPRPVIENFPPRVSYNQIKDFVAANLNNPQAIIDAARANKVTNTEIAEATGYSLDQLIHRRC